MVCHYCKAQQTYARAFELTGKDGVTKKPMTVRYGCMNGHRWVVPKREVRDAKV